MGGQKFAISVQARTEEKRAVATCRGGARKRRASRWRTGCLRTLKLRGCVALGRCVVSVALVAVAASTLPVLARAGQNRATFQVALTILARQPAPRVAEHDASTLSPGFPPYAIVTDGVVTQAKSGNKIVLRETEF